MATVTYSKYSPYYGTPYQGTFLDVANLPKIRKNSTDKIYVINSVYNLRPDMLASDLYGNPALWWVFAMRNPNVLKDPLFDFIIGKSIYLPEKATLVADLGL